MKLSEVKTHKKAFTLIELIVVLLILGLLAAIAVPAYFSWVTKGKAVEAIETMRSIKSLLVPCLRANRGNEDHCFSGSNMTCGIGSIPDNRCWGTFSAGSPNFQYMVSNTYCTSPTVCDLSSTDNTQGWIVRATQGSSAIYISGDSTDSNYTCFTNNSSIFKGIC